MAKKTRKLTDKEFWSILRKNAGLYARTARMIEKEFNITYTRQAVKSRAETNPERLADIIEENVDVAEEGLHDLMRSPLPNIRLKAIEMYLRTKGAHRGYFTKDSLKHEGEVKVLVEFTDEQNPS